ncbi:uncharacterized protein FOMMEDRAFT_159268 [Fomitiporia mediterranea MF3/22]|uniref:uncharacterized protein n=1 Tax=Fomitiporia mediterranea (strain MF3/22) TaxID=694068 RepID=UPI000440803E|nr:uncharacterized protein FOMMEDRAFT_159268 [Fomitiporia mediterranea MF3/22]EJD00534.1 hypothetical protein FOMMEDRAFT_159268 [Fomitiporia mediterranea MF3/22]
MCTPGVFDQSPDLPRKCTDLLTWRISAMAETLCCCLVHNLLDLHQQAKGRRRIGHRFYIITRRTGLLAVQEVRNREKIKEETKDTNTGTSTSTEQVEDKNCWRKVEEGLRGAVATAESRDKRAESDEGPSATLLCRRPAVVQLAITSEDTVELLI